MRETESPNEWRYGNFQLAIRDGGRCAMCARRSGKGPKDCNGGAACENTRCQVCSAGHHVLYCPQVMTYAANRVNP